MRTTEIVKKLQATKTMSDLNGLRNAAAPFLFSGDEDVFTVVQNEFRKAKDRLDKIPIWKNGE